MEFFVFCGERTFSTAPHGDSDGLTTVKFLQVSPLKVEEFSAKMFLEAVGGWSDWPLVFFVGIIYPLENERLLKPKVMRVWMEDDVHFQLDDF